MKAQQLCINRVPIRPLPAVLHQDGNKLLTINACAIQGVDSIWRMGIGQRQEVERRGDTGLD